MVETTSSAQTIQAKNGAGREDLATFIVDGLVDLAIYKLSPAGQIETWSRGAQNLMGYTADEIIGKNFSQFYTDADVDSDFPRYELAEAARTGRFEGAGWRQRKDGSRIWVDVIIASLRDQNGALKGYVKVVRDASERKRSEQIIEQQRQDLIELSTPVMELWPGVLVLPIVGTLDSARSRVVMERLLSGIASSNCQVAILDIAGVPTVDTIVAQYLMKVVAAAQLMGVECIVSGIRPEIAQTVAQLGIDLASVKTKGILSRALEEALKIMGLVVRQAKPLVGEEQNGF